MKKKDNWREWIGLYIIFVILLILIFQGSKFITQSVLAQEQAVISPLPKTTPTPTPTLTEKEIIFSKKHGEIIWRIYQHESTFGKNDSCREYGKFNGFGFMQNSRQWLCFDRFNDAVTAVEMWIEDHSDMSLAEMLCFYNTGKKLSSCGYSEK